ncbi:hypothetical protein I6N96_07990 [Enterococcus sp. BWM-S5]|uniref:Uncharacterized protein n=1 Tax=Enterococcus larvae TaxID=2794352 RepID=A0ABS4CJX0_9ENTE|nr:hypothetical protein [Enterococcus larvae]MBP1046222.1 hypothetical protein [Enterococcus larvae]
MIDDLLKEFRKNSEKLMIRVSVANSSYQKSQTNQQSVEERAKEDIHALKTSIQKTAENLGSSIKGQFGKQAQESLKKHSESLK